MPAATVNGLSISYELVGEGRPWALTPGGRFSKDYGGVRELAEAIAAGGNEVLIWDRPNTGESDVCFDGVTESDMQADALAGLIRHLDLGPTVIFGGSGGSRVSLLTAANHPDVTSALAVWWISGGIYGLLSIGVGYAGESIRAAWNGGMEAVLEVPDWAEVLERNPGNRERMLAQDPRTFIDTMERWIACYCLCDGELVPGLPRPKAAAVDVPALVFRSGVSDMHHTRAMSEDVAATLPRARLVEPPWGDTEWIDQQRRRTAGDGTLFDRWHLLAPQLLEWAGEVLP